MCDGEMLALAISRTAVMRAVTTAEVGAVIGRNLLLMRLGEIP
jgi:hypothetical protein